MSRKLQPHVGDGMAWLILDLSHDNYLCSWYDGINGDHLVEQAHVQSADEAVAWGLSRTPRVRIREADGRTCWAGTARRPVDSAAVLARWPGSAASAGRPTAVG